MYQLLKSKFELVSRRILLDCLPSCPGHPAISSSLLVTNKCYMLCFQVDPMTLRTLHVQPPLSPRYRPTKTFITVLDS